MEQTDVTFYLISEEQTAIKSLDKILKTCEAVDFSGANEKVFYNGLEGFSKDTQHEFEIKPEDALKNSEKYKHSNFTLLEWHNDELLKETAELLEEITEKSTLTVDSISILSGKHEILSLADNSIAKSEFSLAFYFEAPLLEDAADIDLRTMKDKDLLEKIGMLEQICECKFKGFFGGS